MLCSGSENSINGESELTQLHELGSDEMKLVAEAFLEIVPCEITGFKVCSRAFFT